MKLGIEERDRRYALVREKMDHDDLSALLVVSNAQINQQGFVRYFTDLPIPIYAHAIFFPLSGNPVLLTPSPVQTFWAEKLSWIPQENIIMSRTLGKEFARLLLEQNLDRKKIGLINLSTLNAQDYIDFVNLCPQAELIDSTGLLERVRSSKSEDEIPFTHRATEMAISAHRIFASNMRPGITEAELVAQVECGVREQGGERSLYLISSDLSIPFPYVPMERKIIKDSPLLFSVEVSGPGGYWSQIVRPYFWEKPKGTMERIYKTLLDIRLQAQDELRPGRAVRDVAKRLRDEIQKNGFSYGIHFGHGLGLDVVEEPLITMESEFILQENHFVTIHPHLLNEDKTLGVWLGDMYFVGKEQTKILSPL